MKNQITIKRPWQGTVLGGIYALLSSALPIISGLWIYVYIEAYILSQNAMIAAKMLGIFPLLYGISFLIMTLTILLMVGILSGKRWVVVVVLVLSVVNSFSSFISIIKKSTNHDSGRNILLSFTGMMLMIFATWLALKCLQHPYYGGNGKLSWQTLKFWGRREAEVDEMTTF